MENGGSLEVSKRNQAKNRKHRKTRRTGIRGKQRMQESVVKLTQSSFMSFWCYFLVSSRWFWGDFEVFWKSKIVSKAIWRRHWRSLAFRGRFSGFYSALFGAFSGPPERTFEAWLVIFYDIVFATELSKQWDWFFFRFGRALGSKNEHFWWEVLQKWRFLIVGIRTRVWTNFEAFMALFGPHFGTEIEEVGDEKGYLTYDC